MIPTRDGYRGAGKSNIGLSRSLGAPGGVRDGQSRRLIRPSSPRLRGGQDVRRLGPVGRHAVVSDGRRWYRVRRDFSQPRGIRCAPWWLTTAPYLVAPNGRRSFGRTI